MKLFTHIKKNYSGDLFSTDDPLNDDAVLTFERRVSFTLIGNFGATLTVIADAPLPLRWVLQNMTDSFGKPLFEPTTGDAWRITAAAPVLNDIVGVELYRHTIVRIS